ncbi:MAG: PqqD family protein [Lachnospiraceae bacterium]|nr:PqqD family protein [Lachnospiraceae bacterium]
MPKTNCLQSKYQLRYAAGRYWLLNMAQKGVPYHAPIALNSVGAEIWTRLADNMEISQIAKDLSAWYNISEDEALDDVREFLAQLEKQGIVIGEKN